MEQRDFRMTARVRRGRPVTFLLDGREMRAWDGETIAAALVGGGRRIFRLTPRGAAPRGYFCGMGVCHDCLVTVDGLPNVRACMAPVREGLRVETQRGLGDWETGR